MGQFWLVNISHRLWYYLTRCWRPNEIRVIYVKCNSSIAHFWMKPECFFFCIRRRDDGRSVRSAIDRLDECHPRTTSTYEVKPARRPTTGSIASTTPTATTTATGVAFHTDDLGPQSMAIHLSPGAAIFTQCRVVSGHTGLAIHLQFTYAIYTPTYYFRLQPITAAHLSTRLCALTAGYIGSCSCSLLCSCGTTSTVSTESSTKCAANSKWGFYKFNNVNLDFKWSSFTSFRKSKCSIGFNNRCEC